MPARVAHGAVAELAAGDARLEEAAAVAGALIDGDDLGRLELADVLSDSVSGLSTLPLTCSVKVSGSMLSGTSAT